MNTPTQPISAPDKEIIIQLPSLSPKKKHSFNAHSNSFDKVLHNIGQTLVNRGGWSMDLTHKVEHLIKSLTVESEHYFALSKRASYKDKGLRSLQLAMAGVSMYINTSNIDDTVIRHVNIGLSIFVGFLGGIEGIFRFNKHSYQFKEIALNLDGLARTLRSQLLLPANARREPGELILFVESTRDKLLKKLLE